MATAVVPKKGSGKNMFGHGFGFHQPEKKGSKVSGTNTEAETKSTVSRIMKKPKKLGKVFKKKFSRKTKKKRVVDSDINQAEILNELPSVVEFCEDNIARNYESDCDDSRTSSVTLMLVNSISVDSGLPLKSADDRQANISSTYLSPRTIKTIQRLKNKKRSTKSDKNHSKPINELEAVSDSTSNHSKQGLEPDYDADTRQPQLQIMTEPLPQVAEAPEESHHPVVNSNSNLEDDKDIKQGWFQNFFVCRTNGAFILHSS